MFLYVLLIVSSDGGLARGASVKSKETMRGGSLERGLARLDAVQLLLGCLEMVLELLYAAADHLDTMEVSITMSRLIS